MKLPCKWRCVSFLNASVTLSVRWPDFFVILRATSAFVSLTIFVVRGEESANTFNNFCFAILILYLQTVSTFRSQNTSYGENLVLYLLRGFAVTMVTPHDANLRDENHFCPEVFSSCALQSYSQRFVLETNSVTLVQIKKTHFCWASLQSVLSKASGCGTQEAWEKQKFKTLILCVEM